MRFIPTAVHGIIDYLTGLLLIAAPWLFSFADGSAAQWVPVILGVVVILYSLATDYELGVVRKIPVNMHLMLDMGGGIMLLASPWLFGFSDRVIWPHVVVGLMEIVVPMLTENQARRNAAA